ncbi:MAG TPA: CRTAC1 family protein [Gemmataceae bacterium]|nr:CRTAC1 family protein [Gemmataceae bacterium]
MSYPFRLRGALYLTGAILIVPVSVFILSTAQQADFTEQAESAPALRSPGFRECATEVGITWQMHFLNDEQGETFKINLYDHGCGLAVGDYDGDGREDLYFCNQLGRNALYRNRGDGSFEDVTEQAGVALGDRVCVSAAFVDYDNDGRQDLFVTSTRGGNVLFRNLGNGQFQDVTAQAGLSHVGHSQAAVFFDFDNDGYLDLFLTNTAEWTSDNYEKKGLRYYEGKGDFDDFILSRKETNILYRNNGDGTFTDVTEKAGLKGLGWAGDAVAFDYNGDGHMDLFVTNMFGRCQLYRNNGNGTFTDVTLQVLGRTPWGGVGARLLDLNSDGRLALYVVDMHSDMWMGLDANQRSLPLAKQYEKRKFAYNSGPYAELDPRVIERENRMAEQVGWKRAEVLFGNALYRNDGKGKFTEISDQAGLETFWPWGIATGDFDNDGREDVFLPSGMGYPFYYWPNYLLMNQGDGTFRNRAAELGIEPPSRGIHLPNRIAGREAVRSSRGAATGDFDNDGRLDIVTNNFNDQPYFFKNRLPRQNYVAFRLRGTRSNRDAIGAVLRLYQGGRIMSRQVLGACGYLSQSSRVLHFGLGNKPEIDRVEIHWPSGVWQRLDAVAANRLHDIVEPAQSGRLY